MGWARFDDGRHSNRKLIMAGLAANGLDANGITWCAAELTDGFVPAEVLPALAAGERKPEAIAARLVKVGRWSWDPQQNGWWIHDYHGYNPTAEEVKAKREKEAEKKRGQRRTGSKSVDHGTNGQFVSPPENNGTPKGSPQGTTGGTAGGTTGGTPGGTNPEARPGVKPGQKAGGNPTAGSMAPPTPAAPGPGETSECPPGTPEGSPPLPVPSRLTNSSSSEPGLGPPSPEGDDDRLPSETTAATIAGVLDALSRQALTDRQNSTSEPVRNPEAWLSKDRQQRHDETVTWLALNPKATLAGAVLALGGAHPDDPDGFIRRDRELRRQAAKRAEAEAERAADEARAAQVDAAIAALPGETRERLREDARRSLQADGALREIPAMLAARMRQLHEATAGPPMTPPAVAQSASSATPAPTAPTAIGGNDR